MAITDKIEKAAEKIENLTKTLIYIENIASRKVSSDDKNFDVMSWSGGNFDDAYALGYEDGLTVFAQTILTRLKGDK